MPLATTHPNDLTSAGTAAGAALGTSDGIASSGHGASAAESALKYRVPLAPALDGNTVDEQLEQSAFAENSVRYQATLTFLNLKLRALVDALSSSLIALQRIGQLRNVRMSSFKIFDIAGSGMSAQSVRLNTVASNLANADSVSGDPNSVYRAKHPVFQAVLGDSARATMPRPRASP